MTTNVQIAAATPRSHLRILRSFAVIMLFVLLAKIAGAAKEMAVAAHFGTSPAVDAYNLIFNLTNWPVSVWVEVSIAVLVPLLVSTGDTRVAERFQRGVLKIALLAGTAIAFGFYAAISLALHEGWIHMPLTTAAAAGQLLLPFAFGIPLGFGASVLTASLYARERRVGGLIDGIPSLVLVFVVLIGPARASLVLGWGTLIGWVAQFLAAGGAARQARTPRPVIEGQEEAALWAKFWKSLAVVAVGQTVTTAGTTVLDQMMVAGLGQSANAVLGYANRLTMLLLSLGALAAARATLPVFSALSSDEGKRLRVAYEWACILFALGAATALTCWIAAPFGVHLLFERGAFTARDTAEVARIFRLSLLQLPFYFANVVLVQLVVSRQKYSFFLWTCAIQFGVKLLCNLWLIPYMGLQGVPVASSIRSAEALAFILLFLRLNRSR